MVQDFWDTQILFYAINTLRKFDEHIGQHVVVKTTKTTVIY